MNRRVRLRCYEDLGAKHIEVLQNVIQDLDEVSAELSSDATLDHRVILLDGQDRGFRKSFVEYLMQITDKMYPFDQMPNETVMGQLARLQRMNNICWLSPIDMDIVEQDFSFASAVLARVDDSLADILSTNHGGYPTDADFGGFGYDHLGIGSDAPMQVLRRVMHQYSLGISGTLHQRGPELDIDAFSVERMRIERSRIDLPRKLDEALQKLSALKKDHERTQKELIYIQPVYNLDMVTHFMNLVDAAKAMRFMSVPRLMFIVTADLSVFSKKLQNCGWYFPEEQTYWLNPYST